MLEFSPFNPQHIFLLTVIHFLRLVAPLSIGYILASWYTGRFLYSPWLGAYAVAEAVFYLFVYLPRSRLLQKVGHFTRIPEEYSLCVPEECVMRG